MHLLVAQPGGAADAGEPVDLAQSPADLCILSAADTELALLSEARAALGDAAPSLRLASLLNLQHPMSVDLWLDKTATAARLVIARVLGGEGYWTYGLEQCAARLAEAGVAFAALPGDDKPDPALARISTVPDADWTRLWSYLVEGGAENGGNLLRYAAWMLERAGGPMAEGDPDEAPPPARALLRAGAYWPGEGVLGLDAIREQWSDPAAPVVPVVFYRALVQGAGLHPVNRMVRALTGEGLNPLPIFVASLKDPLSQATVEGLFAKAPPAVVVNMTGFAVGAPQEREHVATVLDAPGRPVLQAILAGGTEAAWREGTSGLAARDIAMNVALPEVDGRLLTRAVSFKSEAYFDEATECPVTAYRALGDRVAFVAALAGAWARLGRTSKAERRVALIVANYPNRDGRLANGVGLDTPASVAAFLTRMLEAGYAIGDAPRDARRLMDALREGPTNRIAGRGIREGGERLSRAAYAAWFDALPWEVKQAVTERWGRPEEDPFFDASSDAFALSLHRWGNVVVGIQPARGYNIDPQESYHAPDLPPPHGYLAAYAWLRSEFGVQAAVHFGKHGNLEWLPGKAIALSETCFPEVALGPVPHLYPFIVNDPGEGAQAKRRAAAAVVDHLTPPMARAESYGAMAELEALIDEYYEALGQDQRRLDHLRREIRSLASATALDADAGVTPGMEEGDALARLDTWLCEVKESQIRDGLHVFGASPEGGLMTGLLVALARVPRGDGTGEAASLIRALARDFGFDPAAFDPLDCVFGAPWTIDRPAALRRMGTAPWRTAGDTVERLETLAAKIVGGELACPGDFVHSRPVLAWIERVARPALAASGPHETQALLDGLDGRFIRPGPSGAPTRGRPDVLPTGRNFYSVDSRAVPTPAAYTLGRASAELLVERHLQDHGDWPRAILLTAWGTANMRTGGDDIAQGLALMGVRPTWDAASRRVTGFEILPLEHLGRPRVDVTLRVSGLFRDAFPAQMALFDGAARAIQALDEPPEQNPAAARFRRDAEGTEGPDRHLAGARVFGSMPGAYGAGLQAMIDEKLWSARGDLAESYLAWGGWAYGAAAEGTAARPWLETRLRRTDAVVQNQDNREHDLLDSDDYYQFEGGAAAAVEHLSGRAPAIYHNDHSRPERPVIRTLDEELARIVRARVANPKWLAGVMRHGYKGAFEIAASVDYLFAFAATTGAVRSHHFDVVFEATLGDEAVGAFMADTNPDAYRETAERLSEAMLRGLWQPRSNSVRDRLAACLAA